MVKDFPSSTMDRNSVANARDMGPIPGPRGSYTQQATEDHVQRALSHTPRAGLSKEGSRTTRALSSATHRNEEALTQQRTPAPPKLVKKSRKESGSDGKLHVMCFCHS